MDVVFCTDNNYLMPCGIAIISLLENNKNNDVAVHVVGKELTSESKKQIGDIVGKYQRATIQFYNITDDQLSKYNLPATAPHINVSTYIRLFLFDILPISIEKIIYLDCDLEVVKDLADMWNTNIDNYAIAGVVDSSERTEEAYLKSPYADPMKSHTYVNAGVLLMNLKYWRENNTLDKLMTYVDENSALIKYADQDILNGALPDAIYRLPGRYNIHLFFFWDRFKILELFRGYMDEGLKDPAIIHFTTAMKPWNKGCVHPLRGEFLKYKALSPWKDQPITWGNLSASKKRKYYKRLILSKLGFKKYRSLKPA